MSDDLIEFQREDELNELKSAHRRALRALAKKEQQTEELVEAAVHGVGDRLHGGERIRHFRVGIELEVERQDLVTDVLDDGAVLAPDCVH